MTFGSSFSVAAPKRARLSRIGSRSMARPAHHSISVWWSMQRTVVVDGANDAKCRCASSARAVDQVTYRTFSALRQSTLCHSAVVLPLPGRPSSTRTGSLLPVKPLCSSVHGQPATSSVMSAGASTGR